MRINKFLASRTGLSRRAADAAIAAGRVSVNGQPPLSGQDITDRDTVTLDGAALSSTPVAIVTILFNKPAGYVVSRNGQGNRTIYELLPPEFSQLKPVGRLDKDSSGLLLLTNDGDLANRLTHPRYAKTKRYEVRLDKPLTPHDKAHVIRGVRLDDGPSALGLMPLDAAGHTWQVTMHEGRNRQIRRTFAALGYGVVRLHRTTFGDFTLSNLKSGAYQSLGSAKSGRSVSRLV